MTEYLKRLLGWSFTVLMGFWAVLPKALDWIGRTTLPEDWEQLMSERLPEWAGWLFSTPSWVPAILAIAAFAWMVWLTIPRPVPQEEPDDVPAKPAQPSSGDRAAMSGTVRDSQSFDPRGLYVGDMKVSGNDFEQSHQLEISIRGFNATGGRLAFPSTIGNIEYEAKVGKEVVASGQLLTPSILRDKRNTWENENNSEFNLVFTQPLDPNAVTAIADCLKSDGTVSFMLNNLDIRAAPSDDHSNSARLPVWDGITFRKPITRYVSGRLVSASMGLGSFSMKASSLDAKS